MNTKEMEALRAGLIAAVNNAFDKLPDEGNERSITADDARKARLMDGLQHCVSTANFSVSACKGCPYYGSCCDEMATDTLWLIEKLEAEVKARADPVKEPCKLPDEIKAAQAPCRLPDEIRMHAHQMANDLQVQANKTKDPFSFLVDTAGSRTIETLLDFIDKNEGGQAREHDPEHPQEHRP